jgi:hypothetical protein
LIRLSGGIMLKRIFRTLLCGLIVIGKIHAQEVIVAREKKPEPPKQTAQPSEQIPSETPTPAPTTRKSKSRERKSAPAALTLEQMRAAGGRAAEGLNNPSVSQPTKTREPEAASAPAPSPVAVETPKPVKRETPIEQRNTPRPSKPRGTKAEAIDIGPIRPTMIESGREPASPSPAPR